MLRGVGGLDNGILGCTRPCRRSRIRGVLNNHRLTGHLIQNEVAEGNTEVPVTPKRSSETLDTDDESVFVSDLNTHRGSERSYWRWCRVLCAPSRFARCGWPMSTWACAEGGWSARMTASGLCRSTRRELADIIVATEPEFGRVPNRAGCTRLKQRSRRCCPAPGCWPTISNGLRA